MSMAIFYNQMVKSTLQPQHAPASPWRPWRLHLQFLLMLLDECAKELSELTHLLDHNGDIKRENSMANIMGI